MLREDDCAAGDLPREVPSAAVIMSVCGTSYGVKACIWPSNRRMVSQRQHDFSLPSAFWKQVCGSVCQWMLSDIEQGRSSSSEGERKRMKSSIR
jgi:hypothetical protein